MFNIYIFVLKMEMFEIFGFFNFCNFEIYKVKSLVDKEDFKGLICK